MYIQEILDILDKNVDTFVTFPVTAEEQDLIADEFIDIGGFPKTTGLMDCTHVKGHPPKESAQTYVNRKGDFSINVQVVCDARLRIRNFNASWPGSAHDAHILRMSNVWEACESGLLRDKHILVDSGYPNRNWLLSVFLNPSSREQRRYNRSQRKTRVYVECLFGQWKREFSILNRVRLHVDYIPKVVAVCAMLRNIRIDRGLTKPMRAEEGRVGKEGRSRWRP